MNLKDVSYNLHIYLIFLYLIFFVKCHTDAFTWYEIDFIHGKYYLLQKTSYEIIFFVNYNNLRPNLKLGKVFQLNEETKIQIRFIVNLLVLRQGPICFLIFLTIETQSTIAHFKTVTLYNYEQLRYVTFSYFLFIADLCYTWYCTRCKHCINSLIRAHNQLKSVFFDSKLQEGTKPMNPLYSK